MKSYALIALCLLLLLILGYFTVQIRNERHEQKQLLEEQKQLLKEQNQLLEKQIRILRQRHQELKRRHDCAKCLSHEFLIDPQIVYYIIDYTDAHWLLTRLALSVAAVESGGNHLAVGDNGRARGLFQMWSTTAQNYSNENVDLDLHDIETSVNLFFEHFTHLLHHYHGDITLALTAYNRGKFRVDELLRTDYNPINEYPQKVLQLVSGNVLD